jgi:type III polyketide synthase
MQKVLSINRYTGIDQRSSIGTPDHPLVNRPDPPTIAELHKTFMSDGVPLAVSAARKALAEAQVDPAQVTHMVSTTCTNSANPGYDHFVAKELGLSQTVEKVLLHGVGCSGGLAALRTAANLCLGHTQRRKPARILCVALEISTTLVRSELESIHESQETRIGVVLFSDCASAVLLTNNIPFTSTQQQHPVPASPPPPIYTLLTWTHQTVPETEPDLGFDVDPLGWKVVLSPRVPQLTQSILQPSFSALLDSLTPDSSLPTALSSSSYTRPAHFDWAMHPGGATILTKAEQALGITPQHMRASYDTYVRHGNSSSATIFSVLDRLRHKDMDALAPTVYGDEDADGGGGPREYVIGCAFGPGITVEMCLLRRNLSASSSGRRVRGMETPPETESEVSAGEGSVGGEDGDGDGFSEPGLEEEVGGEGGKESESAYSRGGEDAYTIGTVPVKREAEQEAFISEALEGVELD